MRRQTFDPTAGERAREIRAHPGTPQRITDPLDPRYRELIFGVAEHADSQRISDPTDPKCDQLVD